MSIPCARVASGACVISVGVEIKSASGVIIVYLGAPTGEVRTGSAQVGLGDFPRGAQMLVQLRLGFRSLLNRSLMLQRTFLV